MSDAEEMIQGSDAWHKIRLGRLTASRVSDALATTKTGWGASRANLIAELLTERLTGTVMDRYTNQAMAWGTEKEPEAREAYEFDRNCDVTQIAFVEHPTIKMAGCSPDGYVGDDGLIEIKCPNTATHIETLLGASIDGKYVKQMQFQMLCTGRKWCDFVSYDPRLPAEMQLHVRRVTRWKDEEMSAFEQQARDFLAEVDQKQAALLTRFSK